MINYIAADLRRICRKKSFMTALLGYVALYFLMIFILHNPTFTSQEFVEKTDVFIYFLPLFYGLPIFMSVFYDDFKSKTMQIAIGYGFSRTNVIICKVVESVIITFVTSILLFGITFGISAIIGLPLLQEQVFEIFGGITVVAMRIVGYICMSSVIVYATQKAVSGVVLYVLLASQSIMVLLNIILGQDFIISTFGDLTKYLYSPALYTIKQSVMVKDLLPIVSILTVAFYIVISIVASILVFRKKELEF